MTYYEVRQTMISAAHKSKYGFTACEGVINAIMNYYMITSDFYFSDCITVFNRFLTSGVLQLKKGV